MEAILSVGVTKENAKKLMSLIPKHCDPKIKKRLVYQICGDVLLGRDTTEKLGWEHSMYDSIRKTLEEYEAYLVKPFDVVEGVVQCVCGSKKTWSIQKQLRSCDEPMTTFYTCVECGHSAKYSG